MWFRVQGLYIYIEREREGERGGERGRERQREAEREREREREREGEREREREKRDRGRERQVIEGERGRKIYWALGVPVASLLAAQLKVLVRVKVVSEARFS